MNEKDYLIATNRAKVSMALMIMREVHGGDDYGITCEEVSEIIRLLSNAGDRLFCSYSLVEKGK